MKITQLIIALLLSTTIFAQPGALDVTFGDGGKVLTQFDQYSAVATSMMIQSDGKIVLSGMGITTSDFDIIAIRYFQNGQIDPEFGLDGRFILSISNFRERCYDSAIDENDNILLFGHTLNENLERKAYIIKLNRDGHIDSSFAQNGIWLSEPHQFEDARAMLLQPDGKILISGRSFITSESKACTIIRLHPDGTLDATFGTNGIAKTTVPRNFNPRFIKLTKNGKIITGGWVDGPPDIILIKFNQQGSIDSTFGTNGISVEDTDFRDVGRDIAIQSDNKILVATGIDREPVHEDFEVIRYLQNGKLDTDFGQNGRVTTYFPAPESNAYSTVLQEDGKIILGGYTGKYLFRDYAIARYDSNGNLDPAFGDNGIVITDFGYDDLILLATLQSDGKLLCAGIAQTSDGSGLFTIARYLTGTETNTEEVSRELTQVKILPNPSDGHFAVSFALENSSSVSISIFNASGQLVQPVVDDQYMMKGPNKLDIPLDHSLGDGMYILKIETGDAYFTQKLVIQR